MKKGCLFLTACFMLLFMIPGCGEQEPTPTTGEPVFPESEITSVLYMDFDETWYLLQEGDSALPEATNLLKGIMGREIERPDDGPAGTYLFEVTCGGETHDLSMTGNYCVLDGIWYDVEQGYDAALAECLRSNGTVIPKEEWSLSATRQNTYDEITGKTVTAEGPHGSIRLTVPEGWSCKVNTVADCEESDMYYGCYSISIGPESGDGSAVILCDPTFGVCGTGLTVKTVEIAGREAGIGSYGGPAPAFISFREDYSNITVTLFSAGELWKNMQQEFLSILNTLVYDEKDQSGAIGIYGEGAYVAELDVELSAKNVSASGATICFNQIDGISLADTTEIWTGRAFTLERRNGDLWENVDIAIEGDYAFTEEALGISHGAVTELRYDWAWLYGELPAGDYRMKLTIWADATPDDDGYTDKVDAYAYFLIR